MRCRRKNRCAVRRGVGVLKEAVVKMEIRMKRREKGS